MSTYFYHKKFGFPDFILSQIKPNIELSLSPDEHAIDKSYNMKSLCQSDRLSDNTHIRIPDKVSISLDEIFEVGVGRDGWIKYLGFRISDFTVENAEKKYDEYELCFHTDIFGRTFTIYMNDESDEHDGLDISSYHVSTS